ncbi:MAG TPA: TetR/AcrR family transcriptional regulator [Candidatus Dormibacteraeota bacterium]
MARTIDLAARTVRRDAFLDAAQRLIQTKGYEAMSIQDVLDALETSRGAFYHYFDSKLELLEAVVQRFADAALATIQPVLDEPRLPALRKLEKLVGGLARFKAGRKELVVALIEVMNSDGNALFREKLRRMTATRMEPILSMVIRQGIQEGRLQISWPDQTASVLVSMIHGYQDLAARQFIDRHANRISFDEVKRTYRAFTEAFERILGAPQGSVQLIDDATLHFWFD